MDCLHVTVHRVRSIFVFDDHGGAATVNFSNQDPWTLISLQTPFAYSGSHNLVVAVVDNTGSYIASGNRFATHNSSNYNLNRAGLGAPAFKSASLGLQLTF